MNIIPFLFFLTLCRNSTNSGAQYYPKHSSNTSGTQLRESWKGILIVADLEQSDMMDGIRILLRKAQLEGHDLAQIGDSFEKPKMDNQKLLEEIRPTELQPWQGTTQVRGEVQEDFLAESDGFPPTTKAGSTVHQKHGLYRDQRYRHQNCFENVWENLSWTSSTSRLTPSITDKLLTWYQVYRQRLQCQACLHLHLRHQRKILKVQYQIQHQSNVIVRRDKYGETRVATQPIKQCRRKRVGEQKLRFMTSTGSPFFSN